VSEMAATAQALQEIRGRMTEEMGLQMFSENIYILFLHTDVSVRACTSCQPFVITSKSCWILLLSTVSY